jgi:hypothetical protein
MADNYVTNAGVGGSTFAADDVTGVLYPRTKIALGGDGAASGDMASGAGAVAATVPRVTLASDDPAVTALQLIDNCIAGSEAQVDIVGSLPAGTNAIGKLAANTGVTIGAVEVAAAQTLAAVTAITNVVHVDDNGGALTVDGAVTANAGTNLNTSALALEAGGNLAASATSLALIDNAVSGAGFNVTQLGGAAVPIGAGLEATAVRVTLATDSTGAVSVNAGTNLNTSALALEAGGNLAAAATSLGLLDNAVSGAGFNVTQLGGAAVPIGAGTEAAAVRVTLATDSTGVVTVDDGGGALTVDGTVSLSGNLPDTATGDLAAIKTAVEVLDNCISGTEAQVDVVAALPAGTNLLGKVSSGVDGTNLYDGTTALTIKRASGVATAENANTMIAAVADKKIRVLALSLIATSATLVTAYVYNGDYMLLGNATNMITLDMDGGSGPAGLVLPWNPGGWFQTDTANEALAIDLSAAQPVIWAVTYVEVA